MRTRAHVGYTLVELILVLSFLGVFLAIALPTTAQWRDAAAVRAATDELTAGLAWTRMAAEEYASSEAPIQAGSGA